MGVASFPFFYLKAILAGVAIGIAGFVNLNVGGGILGAVLFFNFIGCMAVAAVVSCGAVTESAEAIRPPVLSKATRPSGHEKVAHVDYVQDYTFVGYLKK